MVFPKLEPGSSFTPQSPGLDGTERDNGMLFLQPIAAFSATQEASKYWVNGWG